MILKKQRENDQGVKRQCLGQNNHDDKMTCSLKENCCSFPWFWRNSVCKSSRKLCCVTLRQFRYERVTRVKRMWRMIHSQGRIRIQLNVLRVQRRNSSSGGVYHKSGAPEGTVRRAEEEEHYGTSCWQEVPRIREYIGLAIKFIRVYGKPQTNFLTNPIEWMLK